MSGRKLTIIGGGSWGTALAQLLTRKGHKVLMYVRKESMRESINRDGINPGYFPDYKLNPDIKATCNLEQAVSYSGYIILSVPTQAVRGVMKDINQYISKDHIFISTAKGIEKDTYLRNTEVIRNSGGKMVAVLSGPTHAEEVIRGLPSAAVIAAADEDLAREIQKIFMAPDFRFYINTDVTGVEIAASVKNIIALAAGIGDGLGYGDNSRAGLITRGLREISRLGRCLGGKPLTFSGLAGLGDLVVTCNSMHSRNRRFGIKIGEGLSFAEALQAVGQVVEGAATTRAVYHWIRDRNLEVEMPITDQVYRVLYEDKDPEKAVNDLMLREPKPEIKTD